MVRSLRRFGQLAPVVVWLPDGDEDCPELVDGFTRLGAAKQIDATGALQARRIEADAVTAKAAVYQLNRVAHGAHPLDQAWIVHALVRDDGLSQLEVAQLLGHHKSWVSRRLALIEQLHETVRADLQLGLVPLRAARALAQLPAGNQPEALTATRRAGLSSDETRELVELLLASDRQPHHDPILTDPRGALNRAHGIVAPAEASSKRRLSPRGRQTATEIETVCRLLRRAERALDETTPLSHIDRGLLAEPIEALSAHLRRLNGLAEDLLKETTPP